MDTIIIHYLNGTATKEEAELLLKWIQEKEENMHYFIEVRDLWIASGTVYSSPEKYTQAFESFKSHILYDELKKRDRVSLVSRFAKPVAAAAAILILLFVGIHTLQKEPSSLTAEEGGQIIPEISYQTLATHEEKSTIILPDGTVVWLNTHSTLTFPETFTDGRRVVSLEGEGYFDVVSDPDNPFIVQTTEMDIRVLGTRFNVRNYPERSVAETTLITGKVEVDLNNESENIILCPDHTIAYYKEEDRFTLEKTDASLYAIWASEQLTIENEELQKIFRMMEHWYGIRIDIRGDINLKNKYSMTIRDESKEEMLRLLSMITPMTYTIHNNRITID
ncbi:MAG: FecR family protein [Tannerellaceae bacterium]|nr:FecR family protein [Tannerellaceae bacterium]